MTEATARLKFSCPACGGEAQRNGLRPSSGAETRDLQTTSDNPNPFETADVSAAGTAALQESAAQIELTDHD